MGLTLMDSNEWLSVDEAAEYLRTDRKEIEEMMRQGLIPHTLLPLSKSPLFSTQRLDGWLRSREVPAPSESGTSEITRETLMKRVLSRVHAKAVDRSRYTNLYAGTRVYAQLHEPMERKRDIYDGICLAIPEATSYEDRPEVEYLQPMDIRDLAGFWKANRDWLEGNGNRFKKHMAMAYHIPLALASEPSHRGWNELENLLKYALLKLEGIGESEGV